MFKGKIFDSNEKIIAAAEAYFEVKGKSLECIEKCAAFQVSLHTNWKTDVRLNSIQ